MMDALIAGERDPKKLAELARARMLTTISWLEDRHTNTSTKRRAHIRQLAALGYRVTLEPAA